MFCSGFLDTLHCQRVSGGEHQLLVSIRDRFLASGTVHVAIFSLEREKNEENLEKS